MCHTFLFVMKQDVLFSVENLAEFKKVNFRNNKNGRGEINKILIS